MTWANGAVNVGTYLMHAFEQHYLAECLLGRKGSPDYCQRGSKAAIMAWHLDRTSRPIASGESTSSNGGRKTGVRSPKLIGKLAVNKSAHGEGLSRLSPTSVR